MLSGTVGAVVSGTVLEGPASLGPLGAPKEKLGELVGTFPEAAVRLAPAEPPLLPEATKPELNAEPPLLIITVMDTLGALVSDPPLLLPEAPPPLPMLPEATNPEL